jgi:Asp-tRNA(Asn)/Glu-tRNA(Gln) amidotransferase A subunit family amidase
MPTALGAPDSVEPTEWGALELVRAIAARVISAREAVEAHIRRIEQRNPALNAVVFERFDQARAEAREADRRTRTGESLPPLHGLPVTIKDSIDLAGAPSTLGLDGRDAPVPADAEVVRRIREGGAIVIAKSNVSQLLAFVECDNPVFGRCNHPATNERSSGGSSGGEGALVASGCSPLGFGSDIGGSVRVPAAFCGVVGFKPTAGRVVDVAPSVPIGQRAIMSQIGVLARHVEDAALGARVAIGSGDDERGPLEALDAIDVDGLRVASWQDDGIFAPCPAARRAVREAMAALVARGARSVELPLPEPSRVLDLFSRIISADRLSHTRAMLGKSRVDPRIRQLLLASALPRSMIDFSLWATRRQSARRMMRSMGDGSAASYFAAVEALEQLRGEARTAMRAADIVLTPAAPLPALRHGATAELGFLGSYTAYWNTLGWPAGVVPYTVVRAGEESDRPTSSDRLEITARETERDSAGLPIGVQIAALPQRDHVVLAAMRALESARE